MQNKVRTFVDTNRLSCGPQVRYMDLVSEIGELGKELIKGCDYGAKPFSQTEKTAAEMGDCLFSLLALCCELGIDADAALDGALDKYEARRVATGQIGSRA